MRRFLQFGFLLLCASPLIGWQKAAQPSFTVKHVDDNTVFIDGGRSAGLTLGQSLIIKRARIFNGAGDGEFKASLIIAKLTVVSLSNTSAMCEIRSRTGEIHRGDLVVFAEAPQDKLVQDTRQAQSSPRPAAPVSNIPQSAVVAQLPVANPASPVSAPQRASGTAPAQTTPPQSNGLQNAAPRAASSQTNNSVRPAAPTAPIAGGSPSNGQTIQNSPVAAAAGKTSAPPVSQTTQAVSQPAQPMSLGEIARANQRRKQQAQAAAAAISSPNQPQTAAAPPAQKPPTATVSAPSPVVAAVPPAPAKPTTSFDQSQPARSSPVASPQPEVAKSAEARQKTAPAIVASSAAGSPAVPQPAAEARKVPPPAKPSQSDTSKSNIQTAAPAAAVIASVPTTQSAAQPAPDTRASALPEQPPKTSSTASAGRNSAPAIAAAVSKPAAQPAQANRASAGAPSAAEPVFTAARNESPVSLPPANGTDVISAFKVKYVAEDAVYIEGGKNAGLSEGMTLTINRTNARPGTASGPAEPANIAEIAVVSVSNTSAVCEIREKTADIQRGDIALLSQADQTKLVEMRTLSPNRKYPQVIAFSQGDPLDEEVRESVPKPPLPEINRARGRIGMDYTFISSSGATTINSSQIGGVVRADMSRIGGSYWNLNGYWRGRLNTRASSAQPQSVFDLVNRTYTIGFTYANPNSRWTAGVGRLYLPWATSLDTTDGGYLGRKIGSHTTLGIFGGTSPDPTSFDYNPDRRTAGTFVAFEGGSFDSLRFTSAEGVAVTAIQWKEDRQFVFSENGLFYKRYISVYHSMQADSQQLPTGGKTEGLSRSFATVRLQPVSRFSIDFNHNYFRDVPTFDPSLVSTGLVDKFLFQGFSVGSRLELPARISIYGNFGQSNRSGDVKNSLNQLYGVTLGRIWLIGLRADARYSKFTSSFGEGNYRAASLSRSFAEIVRIEVTAGQQSFLSSLGVPTNYRLLGSTLDLNLGGHYFIESAVNLQRSPQQNFDQYLVTMGYRFDSGKRK